MKRILGELEALKRSDIRPVVDSRMRDFEFFQDASDSEVWSELCFCLLTANFQAEKSMRIQAELGGAFLSHTEEGLSSELRRLGHRFPNMRAKFIVDARRHLRGLRARLDSFDDDHARRMWLVDNVKGLGMKEASHFLRNIGYKDYAIVDFHIVDKLVDSGLVARPKSRSLTPKSYLAIEQCLKDLGKKSGLSQAELDLYLWYAETGKVLK
ncbi:N-glycosylase/DNA lyase [Candidatus Woesearchaeota archaeon]|nr:N-glycosylase/DNA lyase [Candidatus Woesearchaeota archaeon]